MYQAPNNLWDGTGTNIVTEHKILQVDQGISFMNVAFLGHVCSPPKGKGQVCVLVCVGAHVSVC